MFILRQRFPQKFLKMLSTPTILIKLTITQPNEIFLNHIAIPLHKATKLLQARLVTQGALGSVALSVWEHLYINP